MAGGIQQGMRGGRRRRAMADINVVPYIDVMLVLLVIFMVTAPLVAPSVINLPSVGGSAQQQQIPPLVVSIKADGNVSVRYKDESGSHEQQMSQTDLKNFVAQRAPSNPDQPVVIAADKTVQYDKVMGVMSDLKSIGVKRVGLLVKSK
ncbi:Tol-Pal system protein TolR [Pararobbsia alpina]|jgi:biopolymer transport protein TolR|uniref:protein TolR n=1 Tax=Pararobbsia alpina TaxID=621374 RepID=UPI0039A68A72